MIEAIVIELGYVDDDHAGRSDVTIDQVYSTVPLVCTVTYPDGDTCNQEVEVEGRATLSRLVPMPIASISHEDALNMTLGPTLGGHHPTTISGMLKNLARLRLKDMGENPNEWGLSIKSALYEYVCYGKYSGEVYQDD